MTQLSMDQSPDLFEAFWRVYPRHEAKIAARKEFARLSVDPQLLEAMTSWLDAAGRSDQWRDRRFIPHASTWLHQKRWMDDPPPVSRLTADLAVGGNGNGHDTTVPEWLEAAREADRARLKAESDRAIEDHAKAILAKPAALRTVWERDWIERWRSRE